MRIEYRILLLSPSFNPKAQTRQQRPGLVSGATSGFAGFGLLLRLLLLELLALPKSLG